MKYRGIAHLKGWNPFSKKTRLEEWMIELTGFTEYYGYRFEPGDPVMVLFRQEHKTDGTNRYTVAKCDDAGFATEPFKEVYTGRSDWLLQIGYPLSMSKPEHLPMFGQALRKANLKRLRKMHGYVKGNSLARQTHTRHDLSLIDDAFESLFDDRIR